MAETATDDKKAKRKPKARNRDVVIGCMEERISMMVGNEDHIARLTELMDELSRALGSTKENGE